MSAFKHFKTDRSGATAVIFGLAVIPVMGIAGLALDYGRAASATAHLQQAVDATALALVREAPTATDKELATRGRAMVKAFVKDLTGVATERITVSRDARSIRVAATGASKTALLGVLGFSGVAIGAQADAAWGMNTIELALVLDNTGSMNEAPHGKRKIDELQRAAGRLLADLRAVARERETVKVSIVPFDTEVRLALKYRNADWLRWAHPGDRIDWTGYVEDRDQPYDVTDAPATSDVATKHRARRISFYPPGPGPSRGDIAAIRPLTSLFEKADYDALAATIGEMRPRGNTNVALGVAWGLATLTDSEPFTEAAPAGPRAPKRFMIVLTDGDNTQSLVNGEVNKNVRIIDERTRLACRAAQKTATVFTIRLVSGNAGLLKDCASDKDKYYDVSDPSKLDGVFQAILKEILAARLSA